MNKSKDVNEHQILSFIKSFNSNKIGFEIQYESNN